MKTKTYTFQALPRNTSDWVDLASEAMVTRIFAALFIIGLVLIHKAGYDTWAFVAALFALVHVWFGKE